jgi:hypothetical protein
MRLGLAETTPPGRFRIGQEIRGRSPAGCAGRRHLCGLWVLRSHLSARADKESALSRLLRGGVLLCQHRQRRLAQSRAKHKRIGVGADGPDGTDGADAKTRGVVRLRPTKHQNTSRPPACPPGDRNTRPAKPTAASDGFDGDGFDGAMAQSSQPLHREN